MPKLLASINAARQAIKAKKDEKGLTMIELVVAMGLSLMVLFLLFFVFQSSFSIQKDVQLATDSTSRAQLAVNKLTASIRTATAVKVESNLRLQIETGEGTCELYGIVGNPDVAGRDLVVRKSPEPISNVNRNTGDLVIGDVIRVPGNVFGFVNTPGNSGVSYSFKAGKEVGAVHVTSYAAPRTAPRAGNASPCWP